MGRVLSESPSTAALNAAISEDNAAEYAAQAALSEQHAKEYADAAALSASQNNNIGINTATVYVYQRRPINITPLPPSLDTTYSFETGRITELNNSWSNELPSTGGDFLYVTYAIVTARTGIILADVAATDWAEAQIMAQSASGESYWMTRNAGVISKDTSDNYTPGVLTFRGHKINSEAVVQDYYTRFNISVTYDGESFMEVYTSQLDEPSVSYTVPVNIKAVKVRMFKSNSLTLLIHEELIPVVNDGISYVVKIESTNGDVFKVGQPVTTTLIAHVFRNGVEVTSLIPEHNFRWRRVSFRDPLPPNNDAAWNAAYSSGYKQVMVTVDNVESRATFHCDITKDS